MIRTARQSSMDLLSAWVAGVALLFLVIGMAGSLTPISPPIRLSFGEHAAEAPVQVQEFLPPGEEAASQAPTAEPAETPPPVEIAIPPLPNITPPLQPPEMTELQVPETLVDPPPVQRPPEPQPPVPPPPAETKSKPAAAPAAPSAPSATKSAASPGRAGKAGGTPGAAQPVPFSAAGGGSFPSPSYPSAARSARLEGTVVLLVTVESSGTPSSVEIRTSSGHVMLDNAARDHLRRNWRWPSGESRLFLVPIKFVLK
jgi:TonB family protein